jgi:hypothetical protein
VRYNLLVAILILIVPARAGAQTGGDNTYEFLNISTGALVSSLGGINVSLISNDPVLAYYNPALLTAESSGNISLNYVNYLAGINYGYASYARDYNGIGSFSAGISYLNYGKFDAADPTGLITGSFSASEYALNLIWSYKVDTLFSFGVNLKPVISHLESYNSVGLLMDIGGLYISKDQLLSAGITLKNIGSQLSTYTGLKERVPFEIIAGATARLQHAPFRLSITAHHLEKYDLTQNYLESESTGDENIKGVGRVAENIMRHMIVGVEFLPSENFFISTGFNYQRRKELALDYRRSTVGFSTGFGIRLTAFDLTYSRSKYHLAGSLNNVSLMVKPDAFIRRK